MSKYAARFADPYGDVANLVLLPVPASSGGGVRARWDMLVDPDAWFKVFLNKVEVGVVQETETILYPPNEEQAFVEVLGVGPGNRFADYTHLLEVLDGNKVELTWSGSVSTDVDHYNVYNDNKTGTVDYGTIIAEVTHLGSAVAHSWKSDELSDGTWKWAVRTVDEAGNEETNVVTASVAINTFPDPVTDLDYTFDDGTDKVTLTWTGSVSSDIDEYNIYSNGGSGFIDYATIVATVSDPTVTWLSGAIVASGTYNYGVRAVDSSGKEELNTDKVVTVEIIGPPITEQPIVPNAPVGLVALAIEGAKIKLTWLYDPKNEGVEPDTFSIYYDNATGTVDYVTPLDTVLWAARTSQGKYLSFEFTTGALVDTSTYIFGIRASASGDEEKNTVTATDTADSTAPAAATGFGASETY